MHEPLTGFRLFTYSGRENGLMVIAPRTTMKKLASGLDTALEASPESSSADWPPVLSGIRGTVDGREYNLSFHLETASAAQPKRSFSERARRVAWAIILAFTTVGAITTLRWLLGLLRSLTNG